MQYESLYRVLPCICGREIRIPDTVPKEELSKEIENYERACLLVEIGKKLGIPTFWGEGDTCKFCEENGVVFLRLPVWVSRLPGGPLHVISSQKIRMQRRILRGEIPQEFRERILELSEGKGEIGEIPPAKILPSYRIGVHNLSAQLEEYRRAVQMVHIARGLAFPISVEGESILFTEKNGEIFINLPVWFAKLPVDLEKVYWDVSKERDRLLQQEEIFSSQYFQHVKEKIKEILIEDMKKI